MASSSSNNKRRQQRAKKQYREKAAYQPAEHSDDRTMCDDESSEAPTSEDLYFENSWSLWYDKYLGPGQTPEQYEASMSHVATFQTIQLYWKWFNNIPGVEKLAPRSSYHLMKQGVRPLWEDEANVNGGTLDLRCDKKATAYVWRQVTLAAVGEQFSLSLAEDDDICGITVSIRRNEDIVSLWNKNADSFNPNHILEQIRAFSPEADIRLFREYRVHKAEQNFISPQASPMKPVTSTPHHGYLAPIRPFALPGASPASLIST